MGITNETLHVLLVSLSDLPELPCIHAFRKWFVSLHGHVAVANHPVHVEQYTNWYFEERLTTGYQPTNMYCFPGNSMRASASKSTTTTFNQCHTPQRVGCTWNTPRQQRTFCRCQGHAT
eukprot:scpid62189/ scgid7459/ 